MTIHEPDTPHEYVEITSHTKGFQPMTTPITLRDILSIYGEPDPKLVSKLAKSWKDKNGKWHQMELDYVGHAEITRILITIDPDWNWEPVAWTDHGRPAITISNGTAELWIRLTVLGKTILGVGTASADKSDVSKELIGDALRNAAMRLGIALSLWSKTEWDNLPEQPSTPAQDPGDRRLMLDDPIGWAIEEFAKVESLPALDTAAALVKPHLTEADREILRDHYRAQKARLTGGES